MTPALKLDDRAGYVGFIVERTREPSPDGIETNAKQAVVGTRRVDQPVAERAGNGHLALH